MTKDQKKDWMEWLFIVYGNLVDRGVKLLKARFGPNDSDYC